MTIVKSYIDDISKPGPSNTFFLEFTPTSFGNKSNKAVLSITERYWMSKTELSEIISYWNRRATLS